MQAIVRSPRIALLSLSLLAACSDSPRIPGGGFRPQPPDASASDGAQDGEDARPHDDARTGDANLEMDAGAFDATTPPDAVPAQDAPAPLDATPSTDAQGMDAAPGADAVTPTNTSQQIAAVRAAPDGTLGLPIDGAVVTYVKSQPVRTEGPGFAIQADAAGPALWIAVDPATLTPPPLRGDRVRLVVDQKVTDMSAIQMATAVSGWARIGSNVPLGPLVQDLSNAPDVVTNIAGYELELVRLSGTIAATFRSAGSGHLAARIDTAGLSGDLNLELRTPATLAETIGLGTGCSFTVEAPMWRFADRAQPSAWVQADFLSLSCPDPRLVSASAPAPDRVYLTFDRWIARGSVAANGSQFSFGGGLTALGARATTSVVVVQTTPQADGAAYTVNVAGTVSDVRGQALDPSFRSGNFFGAPPRPVVRINELNANISSGCDLVELRAMTAGSLDGWTLRSRDIVVATLSGIVASAGTLVVVHSTNSATCNPGGSPSETGSPAQYPRGIYSTNFDGAYDVYGTTTGIVFTDTVLSLYDAAGNMVDAVLLADDPSGTAAVSSEDLAAIAALFGEWSTVQGTIPLGGFVDDDFCAHAVLDLNATGFDPTGTSIQRTDNGDTNTASGWSDANLGTWGALNPGQF